MNEMSPKQIAQELSKVQAIGKQVARKIEQEQGRISGFTPELNKIRTHLETYHDLKKTKKLAGALRTTRDLGNRSRRTRTYTELAVDTFNKLAQDTRYATVVLWRFGWLGRMLRIETSRSAGGHNQNRPRSGPGRRR